MSNSPFAVSRKTAAKFVFEYSRLEAELLGDRVEELDLVTAEVRIVGVADQERRVRRVRPDREHALLDRLEVGGWLFGRRRVVVIVVVSATGDERGGEQGRDHSDHEPKAGSSHSGASSPGVRVGRRPLRSREDIGQRGERASRTPAASSSRARLRSIAPASQRVQSPSTRVIRISAASSGSTPARIEPSAMPRRMPSATIARQVSVTRRTSSRSSRLEHGRGADLAPDDGVVAHRRGPRRARRAAPPRQPRSRSLPAPAPTAPPTAPCRWRARARRLIEPLAAARSGSRGAEATHRPRWPPPRPACRARRAWRSRSPRRPGSPPDGRRGPPRSVCGEAA